MKTLKVRPTPNGAKIENLSELNDFLDVLERTKLIIEASEYSLPGDAEAVQKAIDNIKEEMDH